MYMGWVRVQAISQFRLRHIVFLNQMHLMDTGNDLNDVFLCCLYLNFSKSDSVYRVI